MKETDGTETGAEEGGHGGKREVKEREGERRGGLVVGRGGGEYFKGI